MISKGEGKRGKQSPHPQRGEAQTFRRFGWERLLAHDVGCLKPIQMELRGQGAYWVLAGPEVAPKLRSFCGRLRMARVCGSSRETNAKLPGMQYHQRWCDYTISRAWGAGSAAVESRLPLGISSVGRTTWLLGAEWTDLHASLTLRTNAKLVRTSTKGGGGVSPNWHHPHLRCCVNMAYVWEF